MITMKCFEEMKTKFINKKIVYITTKNKDYLRVTQEIRFLRDIGQEVSIIASNGKNTICRILYVLCKTLFFNFKEKDCVFLGFLPQFILPFSIWKYQKKMICADFFISLYDTLVFDRQTIRQKSILAKLLWRWDYMTISKADFVICDSKKHGEFFAEEFKIDTEKLYVLYLQADPSIYYPQHVGKPERWKDKFLTLYFGSILPLQGVEVILEAIKILTQEESIHFILVGPIHDDNKITAGNVTYIEWLSQAELAQYIAFSDLCLAGHFSSTIAKANRTIPGKAYIYAAMGKNMILGDSEANHEFFDEKDPVIHYVKRGDPGRLAAEIMRISSFDGMT